MALTCDSPLPARLGAWAEERFPARNAPFFLVLFAGACAFGRASARGGVAFRPIDAAGFLAVSCFFLTLRVLDEHKDWAADCRAHPDRVLQRGLVTLRHLAALGAAAVAVQLLVSVAYDGGFGRATAWWAATLGWTALMAREFFLRERLRRRLVAYAALHLAVMAPALAWMIQMGAGPAPLPRGAGWIAALGVASAASFEVARKLRAPEDEREAVDSYTKALGVRGAAAALAALLALAPLAAARALAAALGAAPAGAVLVGALAAAAAGAAVLAFARAPTRAGAARAERAVGLGLFAVHAALVAALVAARGLA